MNAVTVSELAQLLQGPRPPVLVDVRRAQARQAQGQQMVGALWRDPAKWLDWKDEVASLPSPVVLCCAHGQEISQALTTAQRVMGQQAMYLQGGMAAWVASDMPVEALTTL